MIKLAREESLLFSVLQPKVTTYICIRRTVLSKHRGRALGEEPVMMFWVTYQRNLSLSLSLPNEPHSDIGRLKWEMLRASGRKERTQCQKINKNEGLAEGAWCTLVSAIGWIRLWIINPCPCHASKPAGLYARNIIYKNIYLPGHRHPS